MEQQYVEWDYFFYPLPEDGDEDPPTWREIRTLRDFVERFGHADEIPADYAARRLMSLCDEDQQVEERGDFANKGDRVSWFLWDLGMFMPRYQRAVLKVVEAVRALSVLERTEDQILSGRFADSLLGWNRLDKFEEIWNDRSIYFSNVNRYGSFPFEGLGGCVITNAFQANHLSIYPPSSPRSPELCRGFYTIVFALEQDPWNHTPRLPYSRHDKRNAYGHIQMLNTDLRCLSPFIEISGSVLFYFLDRKDLTSLEALKLPNSNLWKGDSLFTMQRWQFWKERLLWISKQDELMNLTRELAAKLVRSMQNIEKNKI
ncbi:hypothetical protein N7509_003867 [Penicillium cosmopolitanum]|uniref:Uncharacterized protein n=1 Tax=Penicillium cosmopolitanum TaxID=1131564 RepID=A0A9W9W5Y1_9EURO|nr:uncharacterized protein N7509_003867 [Penicillium cosmopolitanum]KAJ5403996.1 hypothetical protein N7509_003867 [Penicillium cosmopolitanum]